MFEETGNEVYERAVKAMQLNEALSRTLLHGALLSLGMTNTEVTLDELGVLLPQLETQFRKALSPQEARDVTRRLTGLLLTWEAPHTAEGTQAD